MKIALDLDDVLLDFWATVEAQFTKRFGVELHETAAEWDRNEVKDWQGWHDDQVPYDNWWDWWDAEGAVHWVSAPPIDGALEGATALHEGGHELIIVTSKPRWAQGIVGRWLHGFGVPHDGVIYTRHHESKADRSDADVLVDDRPENVKDWIETGRPAVLFDQPWNADLKPDLTATGLFYRARDWGDVLDWIDYIAPRDVPVLADTLSQPTVFDGEYEVVDEETGGKKGQKLARMDLLPWDCVYRLAEHYGRGAAKYEDRNWERGYNVSLSLAALGRHFADLAMGNDLDEDGRPHTMAIAFHAFAIDRFLREHPEKDDRPAITGRPTSAA